MEIKKVKPKRDGAKVVFRCRLSFCHLDAPWSGQEGNEKKYSVSCIIPKEDTETVAAVKEAVKAAYEAGVPKVWGGQRPPAKSSSFKYPLKDGDDERPDDAAYANSVFLTASSRMAVPVVNRLSESIPPTEAYSGCWAVCVVNFYPFNKGSKGISGGLNAVMKWADDEKLGGGGNGVADFDGMGLEPEETDINDL